MVLGKEQMKKIRKASKQDEGEVKKAWHKALRTFNGFATASIGPSIIEADYIFIPCCVGDAHWVLFVFNTARFEGLLLDSMNDEPAYREEIRVVV